MDVKSFNNKNLIIVKKQLLSLCLLLTGIGAFAQHKKAKDAKASALGGSPAEIAAFKHAKADALVCPSAGQIFYEFNGDGECAPCIEPFIGQTYEEGQTFCYLVEKWGEIVPIPAALGGKLVEVSAKHGAKVRKGDTLAWIERPEAE